MKRGIGLRTVISTSAGLTFASSSFLVVVQAACYLAGDSAWISVVIAGALCALAAAAFSELNGMWPSVNGVRLYIHKAFGEKWALSVALTYMSVVTLVTGAEAYVLSHVLSAAFPSIAPPWWIFAMLTLATLINFRGIKAAGWLQDVITYSIIASITLLSLAALRHVQFHVPQPLATGGIGPVFQAVGVAIFLFVGFEWVTPLADEVRKPHHIPVGMFVALGVLVVAYALITTAMFAHYPGLTRLSLEGTQARRQPIPHVLFASAILGPAGRWWMIATSLCMSLTTFNAGLIAVSRFIYGMARDHVLPRPLASLSARFQSPDKAVILVYVVGLIVSAIVYWTQRFVLLVNVAAEMESLIYAIAAACVIALRVRDSARSRPYKMWGGLILPGVTGLLFLATAIGVAAQPGVEYWGSGILLAIVAGGSWAYVQFIVTPRLMKIRTQAAQKRKSRRPVPDKV